jgi:tRNA(Met) cytidine acetyltransferase
VLRGERDATRREAARLTSQLSAVVSLGGTALRPARALLGQSFDAIVLDLHAGLSPDVLGLCQGLVRGGGALILCLPPEGRAVRRAELAVAPFGVADVSTRFWSRLERRLTELDTSAPPSPLAPPPPLDLGSAEQRRVIEQLARAFTARAPLSLVLIAERGRGKSSALGLALAEALSATPLRVRVTAPSQRAASELLHFAPPQSEALRFVQPEALLAPSDADVIVIDEAAQLPVPLLRAIALQNPRATLAFATTTHGYEGTGRGFVLRFLDWLERAGRPSTRLALPEPIRWGAGDPLERCVYDVLALDADVSPLDPTELEMIPAPRRVERDELARDEGLLRSLFGLLVGAHYRTTPGDLERMLDAPNLAVHAVVHQGRVLGATLVAREGGLSRADTEALDRGEWRIRGHALADTLIVHAGYPEAGELQLVRSVRIATHPELRRRGLARALIEHIHAEYQPDLFGTVFGATADLIDFRRALGYSLVRVGSSRGTSAGEPPVVMLRPVSERARALVAELRADLARNLPLQLPLLTVDAGLPLEPDLARALQTALEPPVPLAPPALRARVERFVAGAQTMEAAISTLSCFITAHPDALAAMPPRERRLLERRVLRLDSWSTVAQTAGYPDVPAAMRAFRPAVRELLTRCP